MQSLELLVSFDPDAKRLGRNSFVDYGSSFTSPELDSLVDELYSAFLVSEGIPVTGSFRDGKVRNTTGWGVAYLTLGREPRGRLTVVIPTSKGFHLAFLKEGQKLLDGSIVFTKSPGHEKTRSHGFLKGIRLKFAGGAPDHSGTGAPAHKLDSGLQDSQPEGSKTISPVSTGQPIADWVYEDFTVDVELESHLPSPLDDDDSSRGPSVNKAEGLARSLPSVDELKGHNLQSSLFLGLICDFLVSMGESPDTIRARVHKGVRIDYDGVGKIATSPGMGQSLFDLTLAGYTSSSGPLNMSSWGQLLRSNIGGYSVLQWVLDGLPTACFKLSQLFIVCRTLEELIASYVASCVVNAYKLASNKSLGKVVPSTSTHYHYSHTLTSSAYDKYFVTYWLDEGVLRPLARVPSKTGPLVIFDRKPVTGRDSEHSLVAHGLPGDLTVLFDPWPGLISASTPLRGRAAVMVMSGAERVRFRDVLNKSTGLTKEAISAIEFGLRAMAHGDDTNGEIYELLSANTGPVGPPPVLTAGGVASLDHQLGGLVAASLGFRSSLSKVSTALMVAAWPITKHSLRVLRNPKSPRFLTTLAVLGPLAVATSAAWNWNRMV